MPESLYAPWHRDTHGDVFAGPAGKAILIAATRDEQGAPLCANEQDYVLIAPLLTAAPLLYNVLCRLVAHHRSAVPGADAALEHLLRDAEEVLSAAATLEGR